MSANSQLQIAAGAAFPSQLPASANREKLVAELDAEKNLCTLSPALRERLGAPSNELQTKCCEWLSRLHPDDESLWNARISQVRSPNGRPTEFLARFAGRGGRYAFLATRLEQASLETPGVVRALHIDVTDHFPSAVDSDRLRTLVATMPGVVFEFTRRTDGTEALTFLSDRFEQMFGMKIADIAGNPEKAFAPVKEEDLPGLLRSIAHSRETMTTQRYRFRLNNPAKGLRWILSTSDPREAANGDVTWFGTFVDVTEDVMRERALDDALKSAKQMKNRLQLIVDEDPLTKLYNRRGFNTALKQITAEADGQSITIVRIDLDRFKYINDTYGHDVGDAVLEHVASVLKRQCRRDDVIARIGGDEFSILLHVGDTAEAGKRLGERIRDKLSQPYEFKGHVCRFGASIGIACSGDYVEDVEELNVFADVALYRAKELGRNRVEVFTPAVHKSVLNDRRLGLELQDGVERREFVPYFQPQVCAQTRRTVGFEVLARWEHPTQGLLTPGAFLPVADRIKAVGDIDQCVMRSTLELLEEKNDPNLFELKFSFNVGIDRLHDAQLLADFDRFSKNHVNIAVELLETVLIDGKSNHIIGLVENLRRQGVSIELDDFGSGHASLASLMAIQPDRIKIDRSLVADICECHRARRLITAIIEMAGALCIETIAEGVESAAQADLLQTLGVNYLQGYYFARPSQFDAALAQANLS